MNTWTIIIALYLVSVISLAILILASKAKHGTIANDNIDRVLVIIALLLAPIFWVIGLGVFLGEKSKKKGEDRPRPLPKKLRMALKKDKVLFNNKVMSIAKVNRITGKEYTLEQIYGKRYVASLTDEDRREFDNGPSEFRVDDHVRKGDLDYPAIERFARARMNGHLESVRNLFDPDVTLVVYEKQTLYGVDAVLAFWRDRYESSLSRRVKFDFRIVPCMLYNGTAIEEVPERFARMLITFRFHDGKIIGMGLNPEFLNPDYPYIGGFREAPYTEEFFSGHITSDLEPEANRISCPICGKLSENLSWHAFDNDDIDGLHGCRGVVSVCPHCHSTVEIKPEELYSIPEEERKKEPRDYAKEEDGEPASRVPSVATFLLPYTKPLKGTDFVKGLDDTTRIIPMFPADGEDGELYTVRYCAEEFNPLLISQIYYQYPETFHQIVDCYHRAYLHGIIEAGNNLGILYFNYDDRKEKSLETLKGCAERGNANAIANCFSIMWKENPEEAVDLAISAPSLPSPVCWNLAVLHLRGAAIMGNPLPEDREQAKRYLRMVVEGNALPVGDDMDTALWLRKAEALLPAVDGYEEFAETARDYISIALPSYVRRAKESGSSIGPDQDLNRGLRHLRVPDGLSLHLSLASPERNDHGDISRFFLVDRDGNIVCGEEEILFRLDVERSVYGAWDAYLLSKARHLLPTWWHGGYNRETLIFSREDLGAVQSQKGRSLDIITGGDDLKPCVSLNGDTAVVKSCYWSEWGGLYQETVTITFDGNRIANFEHAEARNIYSYDCGIMF